MIIFVKSVDRVFPVTVPEEGTVHDLKAAIENVEFIPAGNKISNKLYMIRTIFIEFL